MYTKIKTSEKEELVKFVLDHVDDLQNKAIEIRRRDNKISAELFSTNEPTT
jgi:hypothetical protein